MKFTVVLHTDDGQRYGVTVPDLPGCFSAGDSLDDALLSAAEAINLHMETLIEDGVDVPVRAPIAVHQANADYAKRHGLSRSGFLVDAARHVMATSV